MGMPNRWTLVKPFVTLSKKWYKNNHFDWLRGQWTLYLTFFMLCNTEHMNMARNQKEKLKLTVSVNICPDLDAASLFPEWKYCTLCRPRLSYALYKSSWILIVWVGAANSKRNEIHERDARHCWRKSRETKWWRWCMVEGYSWIIFSEKMQHHRQYLPFSRSSSNPFFVKSQKIV